MNRTSIHDIITAEILRKELIKPTLLKSGYMVYSIPTTYPAGVPYV